MINLKPTKFDAISSLVGGGLSGADDGTQMEYRGKTPPTKDAIDTKYASMISEWEAQEYARNRLAGKAETFKEITTTVTDDQGVETEVKSIAVDKEAINGYPDIGDQLDDLYHAGVFSADMTAKLKKVKDDFPKPT